MQLATSSRILALAQFIPEHASVADIGAGDGELATLLLRQNPERRVIASEAKLGPFRRLADRVGQGVELRFGDGLAVLDPHEVEVVVLSGMGAALIRSLLSAEPSVVRSLRRLVLGPMGDADDLRRFLYESGLVPVGEGMVREARQFYQVLAAEPGETALPPSVLALALGSSNLEAPAPILLEYAKVRADRLRRIAAEAGDNMQASQRDLLVALERFLAGQAKE